jgi:hypothetical protein
LLGASVMAAAATRSMARAVMPAAKRHRARAAPSCPEIAPSGAPGPCLHRILVLPCCTWWSLALADAAWWMLKVEVVRSGRRARARPLGFFLELVALALILLTVSTARACRPLVIPPALSHTS